MHVLRHATVATVQGQTSAANVEPTILEDCAVAWDDTITWIGPDSEWDGTATEVDAEGRLVTPGFIDPHTHTVYAGDRAFELGLKLAGTPYLDILAQGGGIAHTSNATRAASVADLVSQASPRVQAMHAGGVVAMESKSGYALDLEGELRMLEAGSKLAAATGMPMVHTFLGAHAVPQEYKGRTDAYVEHIVEDMLPAVAKQGIASWCDAFVETDVFTPEHGAAIFAAARNHGLKLRLHADEIDNTAGAELAAQAGCVSADHLLRVSDTGIQAMADAGTIATLLPTVPLTLMKPQWAPAGKFLEADVPVALASDHNPNNPVTNPNLVGQLACYAMGLTPGQALTGMTWNAAQALQLTGVGSIEVGQQPRMLLHSVRSVDQWASVLGTNTVVQRF